MKKSMLMLIALCVAAAVRAECPGDANRDNAVNVSDVMVVMHAIFDAPPCTAPPDSGITYTVNGRPFVLWPSVPIPGALPNTFEWAVTFQGNLELGYYYSGIGVLSYLTLDNTFRLVLHSPTEFRDVTGTAPALTVDPPTFDDMLLSNGDTIRLGTGHGATP